MNGEALVQALIHAVKIGAIAGIGALLAYLNTEAARDAIGQWYVYLPIITALLAGVVRAIGGATYQPTEAHGRGADALANGKRPNLGSI
jgi:hypothetical protein